MHHTTTHHRFLHQPIFFFFFKRWAHPSTIQITQQTHTKKIKKRKCSFISLIYSHFLKIIRKRFKFVPTIGVQREKADGDDQGASRWLLSGASGSAVLASVSGWPDFGQWRRQGAVNGQLRWEEVGGSITGVEGDYAGGVGQGRRTLGQGEAWPWAEIPAAREGARRSALAEDGQWRQSSPVRNNQMAEFRPLFVYILRRILATALRQGSPSQEAPICARGFPSSNRYRNNQIQLN